MSSTATPSIGTITCLFHVSKSQTHSKISTEKPVLKSSRISYIHSEVCLPGSTSIRENMSSSSLGDILNILMAMKKKVEKETMEEREKEEPSTEVAGEAMEEGMKEEPSTGVVEEAGMVIVKNCLHASTGTISMEGGWSAVKDLSEETLMFSQLFLQKSNRKPPSGPPSGKEMKVSTMIPIVLEQNVGLMISSILGAINLNRDRDGVKYNLDNIILLINTDTSGQAEFPGR